MTNQKNIHWDLTKIFAGDEDFEKEYNELSSDYKKVQKYKGRLLESSEMLGNAIADMEEIERKISLLYTYSHLKHDENTKISKYTDMNSRMMKLESEVAEALSFFEPEILESTEEKVVSLLPEKYKHYKKHFNNLFRKKNHVLPEEMEAILAKASVVTDASYQTYAMLTNADLIFPNVLDSEGKEYKLTAGSYIGLMQSQDRVLRKNAFEALYTVYKNHINVIASLLATEVNKNIFKAEVKKFASAREAALFTNDIPKSVPDSLIEAVNKNLPVYQKALALRKKALGVDTLHMYDMYAPIIKDVDFKIKYEDACETVIKSLDILGKDYVDVVKSSFNEGWIDVYESEGKRSGAYSSGCYDTLPYILLNHRDDLDSMFTLTHEMGHSMHSYLTRSNQPYVYGNYSIFLAEVASTTNECLLLDYLQKHETDEEKIRYLLNHNIEQFRGTMFRQTMFAEFERDIHEYAQKGGVLTADYLCDSYLALVKKYFGDDVEVDELVKYEWARIPHFYYNFYVYQYATGFAAANAFAGKIIAENGGSNQDKTHLDKYLSFLKAGSSDYPLEVLRKAGVDMETTAPVDDAISIFSAVVDKLDTMI